MDVDHYNDAHPNEKPIQLVLDITDDIEELIITKNNGQNDDDGGDDQDDAA